MKIRVELRGGLEVLFDGKRKQEMEIDKMKMKDFLGWFRENKTGDSAELLFTSSSSNTVRPGVLVLINDTDWEILDTVDYQIKNGDEISFISTLHGG
mmetsp:Transcript_38769/g.54049  ORF Transcript_38769/g.54049 Transcript_38769/m.54049 type:complete len:97 (-) Transcript_38769:735-1025(-)|eukprot:CAMPEP_0201487770 /NCGR_PEP_ID=MMETSP0151_2-20130828/15218_1 /ASSEMBLY_ACC=CAM_ASM_000257 /TAXON_ID=200890 /ORGANISM="Paramoeba atlantica, Strain 621/1 / CCAP 1560/9" /LENGTH=96 /DNA_ID=CAMNT_0047872915 /DNA_START=199 /DNA_END=489 /DNA_ORIENTATION=+